MRFYHQIACLFILLLISSIALASSGSISFFASNNTKQIDLPTAFQRLIHQEQIDLQNRTIHVMQKNHIEQGRFQNLLGTYRMNSDQYITAENSERFDTSPLQTFSNDKIFALAQELAIELSQESIAVMIPDDNSYGGVTVNFTSTKPTVNEVITIIQEKLPAAYNQAFSLRLATNTISLNEATVEEIDWLGSNTHAEEVRNAFPQESVTVLHGKAYLVYQDGNTDAL